MDVKNSQTRENLMRAFAGESQARNRYTMAAAQAKQNKLHLLEQVFTFTADQEREHAEIFMKLLSSEAGQQITVDGAYPVDTFQEMTRVLEAAAHNEREEHLAIYPAFAQVAREEGFESVAMKFQQIADIERSHSERFERYLRLMRQDRLFEDSGETVWMCLNCGHLHTGPAAPMLCPVCSHDRGYFVRQCVGMPG